MTENFGNTMQSYGGLWKLRITSVFRMVRRKTISFYGAQF
uniref:Uncharacterized protein n=1 Tax=Arundo donax TaxID=35708 RepID=A0A0A9DMU7_ARUDO